MRKVLKVSESMAALLTGVTLVSTGIALIATCVAIAAANSARVNARKLKAARPPRRSPARVAAAAPVRHPVAATEQVAT